MLFGIIFTFLILDIGIRFILWKDIGFVSYRSFSPLAFSVSYVFVVLLLMFLFPKKFKIMYISLAIISNIYLLCQMVHFKILGSFFSIVSLFSVTEGVDYFDYALKCIDSKMLILILLSLLSIIVVLILEKKVKLFRKLEFTLCKKMIMILSTVLLVFIFRLGAIYKLGDSVSSDTWDVWKVPKNIYDDFSNKNRSFMVSGLYEYPVRDIYLYIKQIISFDTKKDVEEIDEYICDVDLELKNNEYTDIFKDKNLIMIMMESIDEMLVNEQVMPTLSYLAQSGINFENRYAPFFGGAMTINSEFASISGLYSVTSEKPIYNYSDNDFSYSLPLLFKNAGYTVNSIHMNDGEFYNRRVFHRSLGFDNHFSLDNLGFSADFVYDTNIALNDDSYNLISSSDRFMTFITTYSAHVPYVDSVMCDKLIVGNDSLIIDDNEELTCLRLLANETDNFIKILLQRLEDDDILDDTVLVLFSDHYSYGYSEINKDRGIYDSNLIQKTPLIIWSKDIETNNVLKMVDTADIPVTLFNMFGIDYNPKLYVGTDVFSDYHDDFVYFSDYSWYDGNIYSKDCEESDYVKNISSIVNDKINFNKKVIRSNFYNYYK